MTRLLLPTAFAALVALPVAAQDAEMDRGLTLMEEGSRLLLRGLIEELGPAIDDLEELSEEMRTGLEALASEAGPVIRGLVRLVDEAEYYQMPEVLENGDILIRRKPDAPPYVPEVPDAPAEDDIEL